MFVGVCGSAVCGSSWLSSSPPVSKLLLSTCVPGCGCGCGCGYGYGCVCVYGCGCVYGYTYTYTDTAKLIAALQKYETERYQPSSVTALKQHSAVDCLLWVCLCPRVRPCVSSCVRVCPLVWSSLLCLVVVVPVCLCLCVCVCVSVSVCVCGS